MSRIYGEALGEEALYRGKDMILGPGVNIYRTPLNGRNFEYMGEDPYLASIMVVPYIQGLQSKGVSACVKLLPFPAVLHPLFHLARQFITTSLSNHFLL